MPALGWRRSPGAVSAKAAHILETSTLLWAPERLSAKARRLVEASENVVSVASYWEVVIKTQKSVLSIYCQRHIRSDFS